MANSVSEPGLWTLLSGRKSFDWLCKRFWSALVRFESDTQFQWAILDPKDTAVQHLYAPVPGLHFEVIFCVRGVLSPLVANLNRDESDKELERRGHRFVRYADDGNIYVRSRRAAERVMASVTHFLERRLKLKVNEAKSAVDRPWNRKFLGFTFTSCRTIRRKVSEVNLEEFSQNPQIRSVSTQGFLLLTPNGNKILVTTAITA